MQDVSSTLITPSKTNFGAAVPKGASESVRLELAAQGREDLYFFVKGILGYDRLTPSLHGELCTFLMQTREWLRRMTQMPRSHFKTTIVTIGQSMQDIVLDPNIRILLVASSSTNAKRFLLEIQKHFLMNKMFRWLYPEVVPPEVTKARWNAEELEVPREVMFREPTIDTIGAKGAVASRHYNIIRGDDIIGEKELQSEIEMEKTIEWASGLESLLVSPIEDRIDFVGTRWRTDDVYAYLEKFYGHNSEAIEIGPHATKIGELVLYRREAMENGHPIFPEMFSEDFFNRMLRENPHRYAAQYANNPRAAGLTLVQPEWLRYYKLTGPELSVITKQGPDGVVETVRVDDLTRILVYDPSVGESRRSARTAMLVLGKQENGTDVFVLDTRIGRYTPDRAIDLLFELDTQWNLDLLSIEDVAYQAAIKFWLHQKAESDRLPVPPIRPYKPGPQKSKDERIKGLQPLFRAGQIWYQEGFTDLIEETLEYTTIGRSPKRDALDAMAQMLEIFGIAFDEEHQSEIRKIWRAHAGKFNATGYGYKRVRLEA